MFGQLVEAILLKHLSNNWLGFRKCAIHCRVRISSVSWRQTGMNRRKSDGFKTVFTACCSMLSAMWAPSVGEHIYDSWVAEITLHTCLTSAWKSVSKIKGLYETCKEKRTRKCQNTGIFWSKTYFAPKYAKIEKVCNCLHISRLRFNMPIRSP